jgi:hypothetical protein
MRAGLARVVHSGGVRTIPLVAVALAATLLTAGCVPVDATGGAPPVVDPSQSRQELDALAVGKAQSMRGYSREHFPHWADQGGGCNTREVVLKRDGVQVGRNCRVVSGQWNSQYDGKSVTDPDTLDIDHVVPLAAAWRAGANTWTDEKRGQFANDLGRPALLAVSASVNRAKGDQDPSQWKPPNRGYWCAYAQNWITVKRFWQLSVTQSEKTALIDMLGTCQWPSSSAPRT